MIRIIMFVVFSALFSMLFHSCSPKVYPSSEVIYESKRDRDVLVVTSQGYGSSKTLAGKDAEKRAFQVILFRGLPGSELRNPLIGSEEEAMKKYKKYFDSFFKEENYRNFISSSTHGSSFVKDKESGLKSTEATIGINISFLRKELEKHGIIEKFGF